VNKRYEDGSMTEILVATSNAGKLRELIAILPTSTTLLTLSDFHLESPEEIGRSFLDNALIKADYASKSTSKPALADDSGLEVEALAGRPGVMSARFAGPSASEEENNLKLVELVSKVPENERNAKFVCAVAFRASDGFLLTASGSLTGKIVLSPRGNCGFGYDPYFEIADVDAGNFNGRTVAELSLDEKSRISHRRRAFDNLVKQARAESAIHPSVSVLHERIEEASS
jgi:XTP/dITP diphosphohydrolase